MLEHELCCCVAFHPPSSVLRRTTATPLLFPVYLDGHIHAKRTARVHSHAPARKTSNPLIVQSFYRLPGTLWRVSCASRWTRTSHRYSNSCRPDHRQARPGFNALQYSRSASVGAARSGPMPSTCPCRPKAYNPPHWRFDRCWPPCPIWSASTI